MQIETPRNWLWMKRKKEAMLIILNIENRVLVMRKKFYPKEVYRIPTGGIEENEKPLQGAERELKEETGIKAKPKEIGKIGYVNEGKVFFTTYLYLIKSNQKPVCEDEEENVSEFKYINKKELKELTRKLEKLEGKWSNWGKFRAIAHEEVMKIMKS